MSTVNPNSFPPYVHPDDPAQHLGPGIPIMVDGLDWSWVFVYYKAIPGRTGYCVGSDGSFWSRWKQVVVPRKGTTLVLADWVRRGSVKPDGYVSCCMRRDHPCQPRSRLLHALILGTFVGPCPPGLEGCHNDGNRQDNALTNLRWDTRLSNAADRVRHGRVERISGEGHYNAKLKNSDIPRIFELYRSGMQKRKIAALFGVTEQNIGNIISRRLWKHVEV